MTLLPEGRSSKSEVLPASVQAPPSDTERFLAAPGAVWVPSEPRPGQLPAETFTHDCSRPIWRSRTDYPEIVNWRSTRVISDDKIAVSFNGVCTEARAMNGLDHQSDPLPWCRDGVSPRREAAASARYNLDVLRPERPDSSSGEDEVMRDLLLDSEGEDQNVAPGPSAARLSSARRQRCVPHSLSSLSTPTSSATAPNVPFGGNPLIRKESPVIHPALNEDVPRTRGRRSASPARGNVAKGPRVRKPPQGLAHGQPTVSHPNQRPLPSVAPVPHQLVSNVTKITPTVQFRPFGRLTSTPAGPQPMIPLRPGSPVKSLLGARDMNRLVPHRPVAYLGREGQGPFGQPPRTTTPAAVDLCGKGRQPRLANHTGDPREPTRSARPALRAPLASSMRAEGGEGPSSWPFSSAAFWDAGPSDAPTPSPKPSSTPGRMRWGPPGYVDLFWLRHLAQFRPFAVPKEVNDRFHQLTVYVQKRLIVWMICWWIPDRSDIRSRWSRFSPASRHSHHDGFLGKQVQRHVWLAFEGFKPNSTPNIVTITR
ncbi:uncharacterized protein MELLADRAFT_69888 [Melampsora larici-populina 98AG31]|uniref:Uncharacterized protein n=1 Tax=Melampsora larici-populina (strain 98AG31 / pathotype 3-4-7) TaxID=747676 RepID=F4SCN1_MELLP|nr:uncharacterized protein MELLADRAFT_69888 [Melampsora larici-populina 98AG31]EGF97596.1 hypothetical protein MELLADRAFT_69888 [Melampsora larici-populina 98AG31]